MKLSDYVMKTVADAGITQAFVITGGGAMHLNDSLAKETRIAWFCNHHEQASAMAAEGWARVTNKPALLSVTTGPGGINALNGVFGAFTDSIPMLVISGQVKRETCGSVVGTTSLRQLGDQEVDIVRMVQGITKTAVLVSDPKEIRYQLERALHLCRTGRPGPCWIDIPVDLQATPIEPESLRGYTPDDDAVPGLNEGLPETCRVIAARLSTAKRPVLMVGSGVRLSGALERFIQTAEQLGVPVVTAWTAIDHMPSEHPLYCGRPGTVGDRSGNFTVQNSDLLIVVGCRLNIRQVSYNWQSFARHAYKVQVDIDPAELVKPTVRPDLGVVADAGLFFTALSEALIASGYDRARHAEWLAWCKARVGRYPVVLPTHQAREGRMNPYQFLKRLSARLEEDDVVVTGNGAAVVMTFQAMNIRGNQRVFSNSGDASMGYDLPASIGAAVARGGRRVICYAGDGSLQMNLQELQTVVHHQLPIKIFVFNNDGYLSMRITQNNFFGRAIGAGPSSGVSFPDIVRVAKAYGIRSMTMREEGWEEVMAEALRGDDPVLCEVMLDPNQQFEPKLSARQLPDGRIVSPDLADLFPFMDREEFLTNMLVPVQD